MPSETPNSAGSSGEGEDRSEGGAAISDGGNNSIGAAPVGEGGVGGEGGAGNAPTCGPVYNDWLRTTFPYPDGGILGVADFPSSPWRSIKGTLTTEGGAARSTGNSLGVASQGVAFGSAATRARFKLNFAKAEQTAAVRMNAERYAP